MKKIIRFSISVNEEVNTRLEAIAEKYCISKSVWVVQAALEKLEKIEREKIGLNNL